LAGCLWYRLFIDSAAVCPMAMFKSFALVVAALALMAQSTHTEEAACDSSAAPTSLLQKVSRRDEKVALADEQPQISGTEARDQGSGPGPCSGTTAQGRCWFLSELGQSCAATCSKHNRGFNFATADAQKPITPSLVGHTPNTKQEPWAALECYAPDEDRYHTANANAAKQMVNDIGNWAHPECKLACPCSGTNLGQCTWKPPPACASEFVWNGVMYSGCATVRGSPDPLHSRPWCQHHYQHYERTEGGAKQDPDWSYCSLDCDDKKQTSPEKDGCDWRPASSCVREFDYEGTHYVGCTASDHHTPWCSNSSPYQGSWNKCEYKCPDKKEEMIEAVNREAKEDNMLCSWQPAEDCAKTFMYKGGAVTGCTEADYPTPWCSRDSDHTGSWTVCKRVCTHPAATETPVQPTLAPAPMPTQAPFTPFAPASDEDPCTRHPDVENDLIGQSVTLDEPGYKIAAAAESPINMKRFICRTIQLIECKVTDVSALMAFVPYYSGLVSHQSYANLESELEVLCHAGGKWVKPVIKDSENE